MDPRTNNQSITPDTRPVVEALNRFAARPDVVLALHQARREAEQELQRNPGLATASVALDPLLLGWAELDAVGSIRVVVTREAGGQGIERHANSVQYLLVLDGPVETQVETMDGWRVDRYGQGRSAELEDRWHVVPRGAWHRTVSPGAKNWGIVAFHSARDVSDEYK
jgi:quercetin dioxygenase-like cupin family protein